MDNFSVRSERNFHNLVVKPNHMHLLDKPNGYASAMVKSSLSHQMRFTVQVLEEELCAAGNPHVLQIKLSGDSSREPSSWKLFADGACIASGSGDFARECFYEGAKMFLNLCRSASTVRRPAPQTFVAQIADVLQGDDYKDHPGRTFSI